MDLICNEVITTSYPVKVGISTHSGCGRIGQIYVYLINFILDFYQIFFGNMFYVFPDRGTKFH